LIGFIDRFFKKIKTVGALPLPQATLAWPGGPMLRIACFAGRTPLPPLAFRSFAFGKTSGYAAARFLSGSI